MLSHARRPAPKRLIYFSLTVEDGGNGDAGDPGTRTTSRPTDRLLRRYARVGRKEAPACSSDSQNERARWSSSLKRRRERSSTTTSAPSTFSSGCCARK